MSELQNFNMREFLQIYVSWGVKGGMGKNYAMAGTKTNLQARYDLAAMKS